MFGIGLGLLIVGALAYATSQTINKVECSPFNLVLAFSTLTGFMFGATLLTIALMRGN